MWLLEWACLERGERESNLHERNSILLISRKHNKRKMTKILEFKKYGQI